jgi:hypothetical protein
LIINKDLKFQVNDQPNPNSSFQIPLSGQEGCICGTLGEGWQEWLYAGLQKLLKYESTGGKILW